MLAASPGSAAVANHTSSISRPTSGLVSRRLMTSTFASFHFARALGGCRVGTQRGSHPAHLVCRDRRAGTRPAEQHARVGAPVRNRFSHAAPDVGPFEGLSRRRTDEGEVVALLSQRGCDRFSELRLLVGTEHDAHGVSL